MIAPLTPFAIRGVIWYQGESNASEAHAYRYRRLFGGMIQDWRNRWGQGDFPFLFVQLANYQTNGFYDEMLAPSGQPRPGYRRLYELLNRLGPKELARRHDLAMEMFRNHGITFAVYPDAQGTEKVFPFDIIPRVISAATWRRLEAGLKQRLSALNLFLEDVYGRKLILQREAGIDVADAAVPRDLAVAHQARDDGCRQRLGDRCKLEGCADVHGGRFAAG